ncbi:uncharacterized protein TRIVIDRAFT_31775 [Trichoderma virens Gv29-8]|uniref:F-box domain-containing protein n=1 Tax=Hypocrea virens (strain Gv29-8 / FGSC 10586) TaxID=413071 RepID=G9MKC0_HYPVG|nr:uncharacterized protein TRIVIDRAFT_31775 [Trichoderma virens Gv29-8]EHK25096.1 hypothetical protein TRIVIDRAFT_31775 [Trichoderma virens Gv29-8]
MSNFLIRLLWPRSKTRSYILQLPVELLVEIFSFLPPYSQLLIYQTCRPLRAIIHRYFLTGEGILVTPNDRLLYLTHLARSLPDRWVCAKCFKLHQTCSWDTPSFRPKYYPKCGDGKNWDLERHDESQIFFNYQYFLAHRHIELTLKYTRLESQKRIHQKHLKRLLTPYHAPATQRPADIDVAENILSQRSFYPKVVDGRYLLLTVQTYLGIGTTVSRQSIKFIILCPHLCSFTSFRFRNGLKLDLDMILYMGFSAPLKFRSFFPCLACSTDVCIQTSPERVVICTWQDLGPEGTVYDPNWEAIVRNTTSIHHENGSIRGLYGQHEHSGEIY